jgi:hypothetical protein
LRWTNNEEKKEKQGNKIDWQRQRDRETRKEDMVGHQDEQQIKKRQVSPAWTDGYNVTLKDRDGQTERHGRTSRRTSR